VINGAMNVCVYARRISGTDVEREIAGDKLSPFCFPSSHQAKREEKKNRENILYVC
jgi:hypothetical protein